MIPEIKKEEIKRSLIWNFLRGKLKLYKHISEIE
jgi:hypothetical protein